jgi:hypothetical protein
LQLSTKGKENKIKIAEKRAKTPINLFGIDLKIA